MGGMHAAVYEMFSFHQPEAENSLGEFIGYLACIFITPGSNWITRHIHNGEIDAFFIDIAGEIIHYNNMGKLN